MHEQLRISVRGIVQGVGFLLSVYRNAVGGTGSPGTVKNLGSEVEIIARGDHLPGIRGSSLPQHFPDRFGGGDTRGRQDRRPFCDPCERHRFILLYGRKYFGIERTTVVIDEKGD